MQSTIISKRPVQVALCAPCGLNIGFHQRGRIDERVVAQVEQLVALAAGLVQGCRGGVDGVALGGQAAGARLSAVTFKSTSFGL